MVNGWLRPGNSLKAGSHEAVTPYLMVPEESMPSRGAVQYQPGTEWYRPIL